MNMNNSNKKTPLKIIMIDNYDSFTYNLVEQFRMLDAEVVVFRNDVPINKIFKQEKLDGANTVEDSDTAEGSNTVEDSNTVIVISPGPGNPDSAGNTLSIIKQFMGKLPILGICLGHQAIVQQLGGKINSAKTIVHGKADKIFTDKNNNQHSIFSLLPNPFQAARYHSLITDNIPNELDVIAEADSQVMAVQHKKHKLLGFQFHPESILTTHGSQLLKSSLNWLTDRK